MKIDNLEDIKALIARTANQQVEFKETTGQLERGMETLCAFLNGEGGTVLFGVADKGKIIGQDVADVTKRTIAEAISRLEPMPMVQVAYIPLQDSYKKIVALHVEDSRLKRPPHKHHISSTQVQSLLNVMNYNTYSVREMMGLLQLKNRSYFSKEYLKPALEAEVLEPIFPEQPKSPKQKYRLTEKGKVLLKK